LARGAAACGFCWLFAALALLLSAASPAADLWYEDNNLGVPAGIPADFAEKFRHPESWPESRRLIRVYMIRAAVVRQLSDAFIAELMMPLLRRDGIRLALDVTGATWMRLPGRAELAESDFALLQRLRRLGVSVDFISLQSPLSKDPKREEGMRLDYPLERRVADIVAYVQTAKTIFPDARFGLIDASLAQGKDYEAAYRAVSDALRRSGLRLDFVQLDLPYDLVAERRRGVTWQRARDVETFVRRELGAEFGLICTSRRGGQTSAESWHRDVLAVPREYAAAGGSPDHYLIASWFPHPSPTIPEHPSSGIYTAMRTVREFGDALLDLEASRGLNRAHSEPRWQGAGILAK
jgi:hypothetical protein